VKWYMALSHTVKFVVGAFWIYAPLAERTWINHPIPSAILLLCGLALVSMEVHALITREDKQ
jgi:hypothetical protein